MWKEVVLNVYMRAQERNFLISRDLKTVLCMHYLVHSERFGAGVRFTYTFIIHILSAEEGFNANLL